MFYPFSAIVGQEQMKMALLLCAVDPDVGGVLIRGQKGTAKSTAVRGLAEILPWQWVVRGCPCGCDPSLPQEHCPACRSLAARSGSLPVVQRRTPVVDLPLNATEDMVLGGFDFERALVDGSRRFQAGLLARAHRGFVYVDEVNLLVDHLVDVVMDAAASGFNSVEREGVSYRHWARFSLVGTMNPEEGELRPQLLDRFGLCVAVQGEQSSESRVHLLELRERFDAAPREFIAAHQRESQAIAQAVAAARGRLEEVRLGRRLRGFISNLCLENCVAGHRADLVLQRAVRALAAYEGRTQADEQDVARVAPMVLLHRRREAQPPTPPPPPQPEADDQARGQDQEQAQGSEAPSPPGAPQQDAPSDDLDAGDSQGPEGGGMQSKVFAVGDPFKVRTLQSDKDRKVRTGSGRRSLSRTAQRRGRYSRSVQDGSGNDLALDATVRAAAVQQVLRPRRPGLALAIERVDWRYKMREARVGNFLLFVMDASGSMGARSRMVAAKGAVMSLLLDAYQKRDKIAMISFRGQEARTLLPPTSSIEMAARLLAEMPVGGRTPLAAGIVAAHQELNRQLRREPLCRPIALLVSDGKATHGQGQGTPWQQALGAAQAAGADPRVRWVVVDTEAKAGFSLGLAGHLARALNAHLFEIEQLKAPDLVDLARR